MSPDMGNLSVLPAFVTSSNLWLTRAIDSTIVSVVTKFISRSFSNLELDLAEASVPWVDVLLTPSIGRLHLSEDRFVCSVESREKLKQLP